MKAAVYDRIGAATEVLRVEDIDRPEPQAGEVRVRLIVSGVNPTDWKSRAGVTPRPIEQIQIPNQDGAGVIDAVGAGVDASRIGERVWVWLAAAGRRWGTAAQWTVVPNDQAVRLPESASFELGASLGVPALTAYHCLFCDGPIEGRTVLVAGGAGAVGHFAIELAKRAGATVVTTVSTEEKGELARAAGADLIINYKSADAGRRIQEHTSGVDRIVEVALKANLELDLTVASPGAAIVTYAAAEDPQIPVRACMNKNLVLRFVLLYGVPRAELVQASRQITDALGARALTELPNRKFGLDQIAAAHDAVEEGFPGKVLVDLPQ